MAAQAADDEFITTYARDNSSREDIAETFLVWLAVRHRVDRISDTLRDTIKATTPNRIAYFDQQDFDLFPTIIPEKPPELMSYVYYIDTEVYQLSWTSRIGSHYAIESSTDLNNWQLFVSDIPSQGHTTEVSGILDEFSERIFLRVMEVEAEGGIDPNNTLSSQKR